MISVTTIIPGVPTNQQQIELNHFTDGTLKLMCRPGSNDISKECIITWKYESEEELVALIHLTHHLREHGARIIRLNMPYIPNARQDRVKTETDVFTLKSFASVINWLDFQSVTVLDPHSRVSEALIDRIQVMSPLPTIQRVVSDINDPNLIKFYPDEGAMNRYSTLNEPAVFGRKRRNWTTQTIKSFELVGDTDKIHSHNVLIIDDIISKGDTAFLSAQSLKAAGANKIYLFVSHCENTILNNQLLNSDIIERIYTTDSIFTGNHPKITVVH